jgi:hypothetical protein
LYGILCVVENASPVSEIRRLRGGYVVADLVQEGNVGIKGGCGVVTEVLSDTRRKGIKRQQFI